jgi:hypothetical protein
MTFEAWWAKVLEEDVDSALYPQTSTYKSVAKAAWDFQQEHIEVLAETIEDLERINNDLL